MIGKKAETSDSAGLNTVAAATKSLKIWFPTSDRFLMFDETSGHIQTLWAPSPLYVDGDKSYRDTKEKAK